METINKKEGIKMFEIEPGDLGNNPVIGGTPQPGCITGASGPLIFRIVA